MLNIFGSKADFAHAALFPIEGDRSQALDNVEATGERAHVGLIAEAGREVAIAKVPVFKHRGTDPTDGRVVTPSTPEKKPA